jgi:UDP-glucose 4-epimerase
LDEVLVTGGAGFIGASVVRDLLRRSATRVVVVDARPLKDWARLDDLDDEPRVERRSLDLCERGALTEVMRGVDSVIHLAAGTDMRRGIDDRTWDLRQSFEATGHVLEAMASTGVPTLGYASSSAVYGMLAGQRPASETDGPLLPVSMYGAGKLAAEGLISAYAEMVGFTARIVRFGTVVGPSMDRGAIPSFVAQVERGDRRVRVLGDGGQARSFVGVDEAASALLRVLQLPGQPCEVFNVASPGTTSIRRVLELLAEEVGEFDVTFGGGSGGWRGDVPRVELDVTKLAHAGWTASGNSDDAARRCIRSLRAGGVFLREDEPNPEAGRKVGQ